MILQLETIDLIYKKIGSIQKQLSEATYIVAHAMPALITYMEKEADRLSEEDRTYLACELNNNGLYSKMSYVIMTYSIIEAGVDDIIRICYNDRMAMSEIKEFGEIKISLNEWEYLSKEDLSYRIVNLYKGNCKSPTNNNQQEFGINYGYGYKYFIKFLMPLGIDPMLRKEKIKSFDELCQARNVIAHNAGVIDNEYLNKCKWLRGLKIGDKIDLNITKIASYHDSAVHFFLGIADCINRSLIKSK